MKKIAIFLVLLSSLIYGDIFSKGKIDLGISVGASSSYGYSYTVAGVGGNYFVMDDVAVGGMYRVWFGNAPTQNELSLYTNYYIPIDKNIRPYIGLFGRKTFVNSSVINDYGSYGGRVGIGYITSHTSYFSIGYALEYYDNCIDGVSTRSDECYRSYPEIVFGISF